MRVYANLLGVWTDVTDNGTVADHQDPVTYFKEMLAYEESSKTAEAFEFDYINVQYGGKNYRLHPSMIQITT